MAIPKYDEMYNEFLEVLQDGEEKKLKVIKEILANVFSLTDEEKREKLNSGKRIFYNRVGWTATYLKKAGLIDFKTRGIFSISKEGKKILKEKIRITNTILTRYEQFNEFINSSSETGESAEKLEEYTPQEKIDMSIKQLNQELEKELLKEVLEQSPEFLEKLAVKLIVAMGYGNSENATVTQQTNDEGIDGIVFEDELGMNAIYIQTKRYGIENTVSRPELQKFVGAMAGKNAKKGVFMTTSSFSKTAIEYARNQNLSLIDGELLVKLMIKYNVGCYVETEYSIKRLDLDFFEND